MSDAEKIKKLILIVETLARGLRCDNDGAEESTRDSCWCDSCDAARMIRELKEEA